MLDKRKRKSAKTKATEQTLEQPQRLDPDAEDEFGSAQDCHTATADSELLEDVHFMEYTERYMNNDLYDDEANAARFFFPNGYPLYDDEEDEADDDFDDDFDEDFDELSDEEFNETIDGIDDLEESVDQKIDDDDDEVDEWDSMNSEENVYDDEE